MYILSLMHVRRSLLWKQACLKNWVCCELVFVFWVLNFCEFCVWVCPCIWPIFWVSCCPVWSTDTLLGPIEGQLRTFTAFNFKVSQRTTASWDTERQSRLFGWNSKCSIFLSCILGRVDSNDADSVVFVLYKVSLFVWSEATMSSPGWRGLVAIFETDWPNRTIMVVLHG